MGLMCGTAKRDITPPESMMGQIYGLMGIPYVKVIDPLYVRVIAFDNGMDKALIVSFDLDKAPKPTEFLALLRSHTGIAEENILYFATHTHSAPLTTIRPKERKQALPPQWETNMRLYEELVEKQLIACADQALLNLRPASIGYGKGKSYINVNRNRDFMVEGEDGALYPVVCQGPNNQADVDREVFVFQVKDETGKPMAFFVNYAVHCCGMFLNQADGKGGMGVSPDLAGAVSCMLENKYPQSLAVWSSGAAGNVNPILGTEVYYPDAKNGEAKGYNIPDAAISDALVKSLAYRHFADVLEIIRGIADHSNEAEIAGAVEWSETPSYEMEEVAPRVTKIVGESGSPYRIRMQLLRIGGIALCGIGGELYDSFGRMLKENAKLPAICVINHNASLIDDAGYILDDDTMARVRRQQPYAPKIPGGQIAAKAGYIGPSLLEHEESLFSKVIA